MAILTNKGNAQERTVGVLQKLTLTLADMQGMTSGTAAISWTNTSTGSPNGSNPSTISLPYSAGDRLENAFYAITTPLTGTPTGVTMQVGYKGASNTSANAFVTATEILASGYAAYSSGAGTVNGAGYSVLETGNVSVTLTSTGGALSTLTAGQVDIYVYQQFGTDLYA